MEEEKILNKGLEFALEFGSNWLQPIQKRLADKFTELTKEELNKYDAICRGAREKGNGYIYKQLEKATDENKKIKESEIANDLKIFLLNEYPWIDSDNIKRIRNQGFYFGWKDGLSDCIIS